MMTQQAITAIVNTDQPLDLKKLWGDLDTIPASVMIVIVGDRTKIQTTTSSLTSHWGKGSGKIDPSLTDQELIAQARDKKKY